MAVDDVLALFGVAAEVANSRQIRETTNTEIARKKTLTGVTVAASDHVEVVCGFTKVPGQ